jgi:hydrogenase expression/formation protein HypE
MILLAHGSGGRLSHQLFEEHFLPRLANPALSTLEDSGVVGELALTTDSYVVSPRFFPGGDLGRLAVSGTVNDLCMVGAEPIALSTAFILEEGFALEELDRLVESIAATSREAGVPVITGDTKVVARGACDGAFITSSGIGRVTDAFRPMPIKARPGDVVIISGTIADHGIAVLTSRQGLRLEGNLMSDVAPLNSLVNALRQAKVEVHAMRDPTRGGVAQSLIEIAHASRLRVRLDEKALPVRPPVRGACELLGLDPLYVANEGKVLVVLPADQAPRALAAMRGHPLGQAAAIIGALGQEGEPGVELQTTVGGLRTLRMHAGELLPRIC